uniref:Protein FAM114A2 n=1 Tax=Clastoptera arizonana TaxID=38151 RepID=A0A1B6ECK6_9HEMI
MVTSDSEDFESADEEWNSTVSSSIPSSSINKEVLNFKKEIPRLNIESPIKEIKSKNNQMLSEEENSSKIRKEPSENSVLNSKPNDDGPLPNNNSQSKCQKKLNVEKPQKAVIEQKPVTKKLGMKLSTKLKDNASPNNELSESSSITNDKIKVCKKVEHLKSLSCADETNTSESCYQKLEVKDENKSLSIDCSEINKSLKVELKSSIESDKEKQIIEKSCDIKNSPSSSKDGWEIEDDCLEEEAPVLSSNEIEVRPVIERLSEVAENENKGHGWSSWGSWGVTSLLSTATESVSTFSSHVTSGISTVLETSLGVPDPEELAKHVAQEEKQENNAYKFEDASSATEGLGFSGLGSLMSGVGVFGGKVLSGGLDTLETLGKKTMEVIQEGDPMLRKKRAMFFHEDKPVLSQVLKEAKDKAENMEQELADKEAARKVHFESLFDDCQGLVHLEALEMLSKQCQLKLQSILLSYSGEALLELQETLAEVKELCEIPEDEDEEEVLSKEDFEKRIKECTQNLHPNLSPSKIIEVYNIIEKRLIEVKNEKVSATELHQKAILSMAEFTASTMECFQKGAELVLTKAHRSTADEAENFVLLTTTFCNQVSNIASEFTSLLSKWDPIANSTFITNIFLEVSIHPL